MARAGTIRFLSDSWIIIEFLCVSFSMPAKFELIIVLTGRIASRETQSNIEWMLARIAEIRRLEDSLAMSAADKSHDL